MFLQFLLVSAFIPTCVLGRTKGEYNRPIPPTRYQELIGQGFSTNFFKSIDPLSKYRPQNINDVYDRGFRNLRLRCASDSEQYKPPYDTSAGFKSFLNSLEDVVDDCLKVGVIPIISWINHDAEAFATKKDLSNYLQWWEEVASRLKDKDYRLSFNLFTELGVDVCQNSKTKCDNSLREDTVKYNDWTRKVVEKIRSTGHKNRKRIIILGSPKKTATSLNLIDEDIYKKDNYMMAEWHIYASGPNKKDGLKFWEGDGSRRGQKEVEAAIKPATEFTKKTHLLTYLGAWMPTNNKDPEETGRIDESEVMHFARYFVQRLKEEKIPWSLNVLDRYYNTAKSKWITDIQNIQGVKINMAKVLAVIKPDPKEKTKSTNESKPKSAKEGKSKPKKGRKLKSRKGRKSQKSVKRIIESTWF